MLMHLYEVYRRSKRCSLATVIIFLCITTVVGIIVVNLTAFKARDKTCIRTFRNTIQKSKAHDSQPHSAIAIDINNDMVLDIITANSYTNNIGIFLGDPNGSFRAQVTYSTGANSQPYALAAADFNNDKAIDIITANHGTNSFALLLAKPNTTFEQPRIYSIGISRPTSVLAADINNDQNIDVVFANYDTSTITTALGKGNGNFTVQNTFSIAYDSAPTAFALADLNKDNYLDIVVSNSGTSNVAVLFGNGDGSFKLHSTYSTGISSQPTSVAIADFNNDQHFDIIVSNYGTSSVGVLLGNGEGIFGEVILSYLSSDVHPNSMVVGDFNRDNKTDVAISTSGAPNIVVLEGQGNGSFSIDESHTSTPGSTPSFLIAGDFNGDRKLDLATVNNYTNSIEVFLRYSKKVFENGKFYQTGVGSNPSNVVVGDVNEDNILDILVMKLGSNEVDVFVGRPKGSFYLRDTITVYIPLVLAWINLADINNDKHIDLLLACSNNNAIVTLLGSGNATFDQSNIITLNPMYSPQLSIVADINNDSNPDLLISYSTTNYIGIFLGYRNGSFATEQLVPTGNTTETVGVAVGDINNDGVSDIVATNTLTDIISVIIGYRNSTFTSPRIISVRTGSGPFMINLRDLNRDGCLDIVVLYYMAGSVGILFGDGYGNFIDTFTYSLLDGSQPVSMALADFNNDNIVDIAVACSGSNAFAILLGNNDGSFDVPTFVSTGSGSRPTSLAVGQFNNDNWLDLVVANGDGDSMAVYLGDRIVEATSQAMYSTGSGSHPYSLVTSDFNNDNILDLLIVNSAHDSTSLRLGVGDGTFSGEIVYPTVVGAQPRSAAAADFNGDSYMDFVVANYRTDSISVIYPPTNRTGTRMNVYSTGSGSKPYFAAVADLNGDRQPDIVVANEGSDDIGVFYAFPYVKFVKQSAYPLGMFSGPKGLIAADFNRDNITDIAIAISGANQIGVFLGFRNGTLKPHRMIPTGNNSEPTAIASSDFNNDRIPDIVVANAASNNVVVLIGIGDGRFSVTQNISSEQCLKPLTLSVEDFNIDSNVDIAVGCGESGTVGVWLGFGNGTFSTLSVVTNISSFYITDLTVADFNNDSRPDIVATCTRINSIRVFLGYGNGNFRTGSIVNFGSVPLPAAIASGDFNDDRRSDIVVLNYGSWNIGILLGYGNGSFVPMVTYACGDGSMPTGVRVSDLNKDGASDIVVANHGSNNVGVFFGYGNGRFTDQLAFPVGSGSQPFAVVVADFNYDGLPDIALSNFRASNLMILRQNGTQRFLTMTSSPTGLNSDPRCVVIVDLNSDSMPDIVVANSGTDNVGVFLGYDGESFLGQMQFPVGQGGRPSAIATGDFNHDGRFDIVVANVGTNNVGMLLGLGNGSFSLVQLTSTETCLGPISVAVSDMNNDQFLDVVVASSLWKNVIILFGDGQGKLPMTENYWFSYISQVYWASIGDFNRDDWTDIAVPNYGTDNIEVLLQVCA